MSAVLHAPVLILFGMHNQFFSTLHGCTFFYSFANYKCWKEHIKGTFSLSMTAFQNSSPFFVSLDYSSWFVTCLLQIPYIKLFIFSLSSKHSFLVYPKGIFSDEECIILGLLHILFHLLHAHQNHVIIHAVRKACPPLMLHSWEPIVAFAMPCISFMKPLDSGIWFKRYTDILFQGGQHFLSRRQNFLGKCVPLDKFSSDNGNKHG